MDCHNPPQIRGRYLFDSFDGFLITRCLLGGVLLIAAALKAYSFLTHPFPDTGPLVTTLLTISLVAFEVFFGLWLFSGLTPRLTWKASFICFGLFAGVTLVKAFSGAATCGCFGNAPLSP